MSVRNTDELIVYSNSRNGLGIRILGNRRVTNKSGVYIKQLLDNGLAQRDGRLKIGDQILSINDETSIGISREYAVNILRSAAATNQVRLHVRHFFPPLSSNEYQKLLFDEKSTDDDNDEDIIQIINSNTNDIKNEVRMRQSSRRHDQEQQYRHTAYNITSDNNINDQIIKGLDISHDALQSLLNSRFKLIDLVDLLKKTYPNLLRNDQRKEFELIQELSQTNKDGRITLKDFERQSSFVLGERINLLLPFYSSRRDCSNKSDNEIIVELRREISLCRSRIDELQNKIVTCEKSQHLSQQVETEYEDLLKFIDQQLRQYQINQKNQFKFIQANDQLIQKLFYYLSNNIKKSTDQHHLSQLKYQYEQQQKILSSTYQQKSNDISTFSNKKSQPQI